MPDDDIPTLDEVQQMADEDTLEVERRLIEETDNSVRPEDGEQPPQDAEPVLADDDA